MKPHTKILAVLLLALAVTAQGALTTNLVKLTVGSADTLPLAMSKLNTNLAGLSRQVDAVPGDYDLKSRINAPNFFPVNSQEAKRAKAQVFNNAKITVAFSGDSVGTDAQPAFESEIIPFLPRAGCAGNSTPWHLGNYFYGSVSGTRTEYPVGLDGVFWGAFTCYGNGAILTSVSGLSNGIVANSVGAAWYSSSGFGSWLVETQSVSHGVWGTLTTLSASGGAGLTLLTTNITVPVTNYAVRFTSTGTNILVGTALRDMRTGRGYIASAANTPGYSPIGFMINAGSNNVAKYYSWVNPDLFFYQAERLSTATNEVPWLDGLLRATVPQCDLVFLAHHLNHSTAAAIPGSYSNRMFYLDYCQRSNRMFLDTYAKSVGLFSLTNNGLMNADKVHLENVGRAVLHAGIASEVGLSPGALLALGCAWPSGGGLTQTNDLTKANLAGGNTFNGNQSFNDYVNFYKNPTIFGTAVFGMEDQSRSGHYATFYYKTNTFFWTESDNAYKAMFSIVNQSGIPRLDYDSSSYGASEIGFPGRPWGRSFFKSYVVSSNSLSIWPTTPQAPGDALLVNSNGVVYLLTSGIGNTWTATNKLAP